MLFGEYDYLSIAELPSGKEAAAATLAALGTGAITDTRTMLAMTGAEAKVAFETGQALRPCLPSSMRDLTHPKRVFKLSQALCCRRMTTDKGEHGDAPSTRRSLSPGGRSQKQPEGFGPAQRRSTAMR
jgi:hypothetical protein